MYIHTCFFSTPGIQKWGKLTSFGVDIFFCQLLESKKWGKLTSFGVDMFFSQLLDSKKLTKLTSFRVDGMKLRTTTLQI